MDRLAAFETMLADIQKQAATEAAQMEALKAAGKEKTVTFKQLLANRLTYKLILDKYREYGLL